MAAIVFVSGCKKDNDSNYNGNPGITPGGGGVTNHEYVDLGLPSGSLWATCNVGAFAPEEYGDYFAWGETEPKNTYYSNTYKYYNGDYHQITKYCNDLSYGYLSFTDNLTTLLPEDDAATANWGNGWCTPTKEQWEELLQNTTHTWTTQNGMNGWLFHAGNGNSLFLPAAGSRWEDDLFNAGSGGRYWSSSLNTNIPSDAWSIFFYSDEFDIYRFDLRSNGESVRPVRSADSN